MAVIFCFLLVSWHASVTHLQSVAHLGSSEHFSEIIIGTMYLNLNHNGLNSMLTQNSHLCLCLQSGLFLLGFQNKLHSLHYETDWDLSSWAFTGIQGKSASHRDVLLVRWNDGKCERSCLCPEGRSLLF